MQPENTKEVSIPKEPRACEKPKERSWKIKMTARLHTRVNLYRVSAPCPENQDICIISDDE